MAWAYGKLSGQSGNGQSIALSTSPATAHTNTDSGVPHEVTILANATVAEDITVKVAGESTGVVESLEANKTRVIWTGIIVGGVSNNTVTLTSTGSTARAWGKYRKLT